MAKTKTETVAKKKPRHKRQLSKTPEQLYTLATDALEQLDETTALQHAESLLSLVDPHTASGSTSTPSLIALPALNLLGEIHIELGNPAEAQHFFTLAVSADPDGTAAEEQGGGAEKFLWLAQLSEEGGFDSVRWYQKGVACLKSQIASLETSPAQSEETLLAIADRKVRLANALCSVAEIYMTDLSWEEDAEQRCEQLVTEAMLYAPEDPSVLQTLASVRLSQMKVEDARSALTRSMEVWKDLDPDDDAVPDYPTRVSLARLLMEAEMEDEAMVVLERLALEDDQSVEACYLGGWCLHLLAEKRKSTGVNAINDGGSEYATLRVASGKWLRNTLALYEQQQYEDVRIKQHTEELLEEVTAEVGGQGAVGEADEFEEWIDEEDSGDEEMAEA